jgi:hypothetical protein
MMHVGLYVYKYGKSQIYGEYLLWFGNRGDQQFTEVEIGSRYEVLHETDL